MKCHWVVELITLFQLLKPSKPVPGKYNQRVFEDVPVINFPDPTKNGFRVVLSDAFIKRHLRPASLPTLFVSAIPLKSEQRRFTKVLYPEKISEDKLVKIVDLKERSWYYVCVEWENINRYNETTGATCRLYRTLDRYGKSGTTTVGNVAVVSATDTVLRFKAEYQADFPLRLTAYLNSASPGIGLIPSQTFVLRDRHSLDITFRFLNPETNYGQLCIVEEPMVVGYTAMGRLVTGLTREKCYFDGLQTKALHNLPLAMEPESLESRSAVYSSQIDTRAKSSSLKKTVSPGLVFSVLTLCSVILPL